MKYVSFFLGIVISINCFSQNKYQSKNQLELIHFDNKEAYKSFSLSETNIMNGVIKKANSVALIVSKPFAIKIEDIQPFLSFSCGWNEDKNAKDKKNSSIEIRFSHDGINWGKWQEVNEDEHSSNTKFQFVSQLVYAEKETRFYQLRIQTNLMLKGCIIKDLFLNFFSPGNVPSKPNIKEEQTQTASRTTACPCDQPTFINRTGWGCTQGAISYSYTTVTHLIIHHSAGSNTSSNWPAVVLSIWNSHVNTNGWADIGYNWLIDPNGQLYEGRGGGNNVVGAHFCGFNTGTMGTCMLGTYTSQNITDTARKKLIQILAWKSCNSSINPIGTAFHATSNLTLNRISGHRDGCATDCPGNFLYQNLPALRTDVNTYINSVCNATTIADIQGLEDLIISPNPTKGFFTINIRLNSSKLMKYSILNSDGKILYNSGSKQIGSVFTEQNNILDKYPAGNYVLKIMLDNQSVMRQIMKQ
jgi:hypothetical protein